MNNEFEKIRMATNLLILFIALIVAIKFYESKKHLAIMSSKQNLNLNLNSGILQFAFQITHDDWRFVDPKMNDKHGPGTWHTICT